MNHIHPVLSLFAILAFSTFSTVSCIYDDSEIRDRLSGLDGRVGILEEKMLAANESIATLQGLVSALSSNAFVNSVTETEDGWILSLSNGKILTVRNGKDGENGTSPDIGVRMDTDGTFYWTLNGEWMLGPDGERIPVTGENGADGKDAVSPSLKLDGDSWYISTDGGLTWQLVGVNPSSEGIISSVDTSNPDYVVIILSDGTVLRLPTWAAFDALRQYVKQLNINLSSLSSIVSALMDNDYLVSTTPFVEDGVPVGWLLNFSKSGLVVIYSSGDSASPHIGVQQDSDGIYYWTLDGDWLLDANGAKVRAQGSDGKDAPAPKLKIEGQYWYISYDDGVTWTELGKATGEDGDSFFSEVDISSDEFVLLVLADGSAIKVPKYVALDILLDLPRDLVIDHSESIRIPFSIIGTNHEDVSVTALVNGSFKATVNRDEGRDNGRIDLWEEGFEGGTLVVILSTANGTAVVKSATFSPRSICLGTSSYDLPKDLYYGSFSAYVSSQGGTLELTYFTNTSFSIDTSGAPWIRVVKDCSRPAGASGTIVLEVEKNDDLSRIGTLRLSFDDPQWSGTRQGTPEYKFTVNQGGASVEMGVSQIEASKLPTRYEVDVRSTLANLYAYPRDSWMSTSMQNVSDGVYKLIIDIEENDEENPRNSAVYIMSGGTVAGILPVVQYHYENRFPTNAMVMEVLALQENGCTVCLPYTGTLNLMVDWGDGIVSLHEQLYGTAHPVRHSYGTPGEYTVKVYGKLQAMSTIGPDGSIASLATIESVTQWGDCHYMESMENAFNGVTTLKSLASDQYNNFVYVTSFRGAFSGCVNLSEFPSNFFDAAWTVSDFTDAFNGVGLVQCESPFSIVDGEKVHLYERTGITSYSGCFSGGHWADQEAIHAAGWD